MNIDYELLESIATQIEAVEGDCVGHIKTIRNCVELREKTLREAYQFISDIEGAIYCGCPYDKISEKTKHRNDCMWNKADKYLKGKERKIEII